MHFATNNRIRVTALFSILFLLGLPQAFAADLPLMTWERGKEQNIVLGGAAVPENWQMELRDDKSTILKFKRSQPNKKGFVVYSTYIPTNFAAGNYYLTVIQKAGDTGSVVAGVNVVPMQTYEITKVPRDLKLVLWFIGIFLTILSTSRARKYLELEYFSPKFPDNATSYLEKVAKQKFFITSAFTNLRKKPAEDSSATLIGYFLERNDAFLLKLSPILYKYLPLAGIGLGLAAGALGFSTFPELPYIAFLILLVLSAVDFRSSLFASFSYTALQIALGNSLSIKSFLSIFFAIFGVIAATLVGELFQQLIKKDWERFPSFDVKKVLFTATNLVSAVIASIFFIFSTLIKQSLSGKSLEQYQTVYLLAFSIFLVAIAKFYLYEMVDKWGQRTEALPIRVVQITKPVNAAGVLGYYAVAASVAYIWSANASTALIAGIALSLPLVLVLVKRSGPGKLKIGRKIPHNILIESLVVFALTYALIQLIGLRPLAVLQRSETLLALGFTFVTLHALVFSFLDNGARKSEEAL